MIPSSHRGVPTAARRRIGRRTLLAAIAPVVALVAACGGTSSGGGTTNSSSTAQATSSSAVSYPVTVTAANGQVTVKARPKKIVSLSPTATEMLYAIGAGSQVAAVDSLSNYPAEAPKTELSAFQPNAEAVAGYTPDLVVLSTDANGLLKALEKFQIPALLLPAAKDLQDSYAQEVVLGQITGHPDEAAAVVKKTQARIDGALASAPKATTPLKVYHEVDQTYYSVTSGTFLGGIYKLFGLQNIADAKGTASNGGYPQLSAEYVISSTPDLIVLADGKCCQQSPESVAKRPAFSGLPAVKNGKVVAIDDDIASRWGPRTADFAETVAKVLGGK